MLGGRAARRPGGPGGPPLRGGRRARCWTRRWPRPASAARPGLRHQCGVKHFKHERRGKKRIHQTPTTGEVTACRWWLDTERRIVRPQVIVALGATAALSVFGQPLTIGKFAPAGPAAAGPRQGGGDLPPVLSAAPAGPRRPGQGLCAVRGRTQVRLGPGGLIAPPAHPAWLVALRLSAATIGTRLRHDPRPRLRLLLGTMTGDAGAAILVVCVLCAGCGQVADAQAKLVNDLRVKDAIGDYEKAGARTTCWMNASRPSWSPAPMPTPAMPPTPTPGSPARRRTAAPRPRRCR